ncbi:threonine/serine exporter family protein [Streptococcus thoraltensis]|uniref:threonine/serine exporter family protein n=1 Tax=Streptococcus thoraltensis TaxID=55085 RepID=UPI002A83DF15|nr:threonine/serine exporter family protein [Streptococcus thoraltensis]MDY4761044.1 threonine/serine exporter family protein [Streptococcus thoraltensis]
MEENQYKMLVKVATLAGIIMLESNAESYRVETTVERILSVSQLPTVEAFANTTGLFITLDGPDFPEPITYVKRISQRETHLSKIHAVNQISRDLISKEIDLATAYHNLLSIKKDNYSIKSSHMATILLVLSFAVLLGGDFNTFLLAMLASFLLVFTYYIRQMFQLNDFIFGIFATMVVAFCMPFITRFVGASDRALDITIISVLMPLFPGTAFTNGFRDSFKGDYGAGVAKIVEALTIAVSLGVGVALGLFIAKGIMS